MTTTIESRLGDRVMARLEERRAELNIKEKEPGKYRMNSPIRTGSRPSDSGCFLLTIEGDGRRGYWIDNVTNDRGNLHQLAKELGLPVPEKDPDAGFQAIYDYYDEAGNRIYQVCRKVQPNGKKTFLQRHDCPDQKDLVWNMGGNAGKCSCPKIRRSLYRLPELMRAEPGDTVLIVEGEKDVDTARQHNWLATCNSGGAGKFGDVGDLVKYFKGLNVVIIPDNDQAGQDHARDVERRLVGIAESVLTVNLVGLGKGGDLTDFLVEVGSMEAVAQLIDDARRKAAESPAAEVEPTGYIVDTTTGEVIEAPPPRLKTISAHDILTSEWQAPEFVVVNLIPIGLIILAGKPKVGKSWLVLQLCKAVAAGIDFMGEKVQQGKVLYLALEDTPARLKDRMRKQGWTTDLPCDFLTVGDFKDQIGDFRKGGAEILANAIKTEGYKLVVIDTFSRTVFTNQLEQHEMSAILDPLQAIAHRCGCALVIIDHMAKNAKTEEDPINDIFGSVAKGATLDTGIGLYRKRGSDEGKLLIDGRDIDGQKSLAIHFDSLLGSWIYDGDVFTVKTTERRKQIMGVIHNMGPINQKDLAELLEISSAGVYQNVAYLIESGWVVRGDDKCYQLTDEGCKIINAKKG